MYASTSNNSSFAESQGIPHVQQKKKAQTNWNDSQIPMVHTNNLSS